MEHATFRQPLPEKFAADMSKGYQLGSAEPKPFEIVTVAPAGSIAISGADMAPFMIAHLQNGAFGFLKASGKDLKFETLDTPVKFWGVNAGAQMKDTDEDMVRRARYFAKHGINMVRQHPLNLVRDELPIIRVDQRHVFR